MTNIILIRHCEAMGNLKKVFQGHTDEDITKTGEKQLKALAERFEDIAFDTVYSSPLTRAFKTAQAISARGNHSIIIEPMMIEINVGEIEGISYSDFPELFPEHAKAWSLYPCDFSPKGGETMRDFNERVWNAALKIVKNNFGKTVCVVSHGCVIRNLLCNAKGYGLERLNEVDWCDNTGVSMIEFDPEFNAKVLLESDASHLQGGLSAFSRQGFWKSHKGVLTE